MSALEISRRRQKQNSQNFEESISICPHDLLRLFVFHLKVWAYLAVPRWWLNNPILMLIVKQAESTISKPLDPLL